ncbi:uncharacterized protein EV154DRAFT_397899, partial [Mucor mucedo]|uniref:uncharacterized protein n=1 Tax=Mucor mucedo TaxID=29922 RepID=UPI0022212545
MLKKNGFEVFLIDEFRTSSFCPDCEQSLKKIQTITSLRPYRRKETPTIICYGLLGYENVNCLIEYKDGGIAERKLWNRDLAAVLNFKKILESL